MLGVRLGDKPDDKPDDGLAAEPVAIRAAAMVCNAEPAEPAEPAAGARGVVAGSRSHPLGATGSAGVHAALSAFNGCFCTGVCARIGSGRGVWRGVVPTSVRSTGSACAVWLRVFIAPARQLAAVPRAVASLAVAAPAAAPAAVAPRPPAGGRQTVGRA